jgi:hypothetical protein
MSLLLMRVLCDTWYLIFLLCRLTHSLPWDGASKTPRSSPTARTRDLAPTSPALLIQKRDDPPERCGYLWAQTEWACKPYSTCLWVTNYGAVGCCRDTTNLNTCSIYTSCVDFADLPACSGSCSSDGLILRW